MPPETRAALLDCTTDLMESEMQHLTGLIIRRAGKTLSNVIVEVYETVDFLRYYAAQACGEFSNNVHRLLGPVVCINP